ncbi:MAG: stage III sporulation protein AF [Tissierellia bacterium]|nr:stage III sporulation protein AF [Tissierellia bacterium]
MGFVEFLRLWVKDMALIFILISIIEIVLPNSNMKRYINVVMGFLIILVIISPIVKLVLKDFNMDKEVFHNIMEGIEFEREENSKFTSIQEEQVKKIYINKIKGEVKELVAGCTDHTVESINISIGEEDGNYGDIEEIEIILNKGIQMESKEETGDIIKVANIETISIGEKGDDFAELVELEDSKEIKKILSNNYNIPEEDIRIFLNTVEEGELDGEVD